MSEQENEVTHELRITNKLLAQILLKDATTQTERIVILESCGFSNTDIADLLKLKVM